MGYERVRDQDAAKFPPESQEDAVAISWDREAEMKQDLEGGVMKIKVQF